VLAYGRFKMLTNRYKPKLIIYEITPGYDYGTKEPNTKYLGYLRPYYGENGVKSLFDDFDDEFSFLKMKSLMYQNSGKLLPNLFDNFIYRDNLKGYAPLYGEIKSDISNLPQEDRIKEIDSIKLFYVEKLIVEAKKNCIPIVFVVSPRFGIDSDTNNYEVEIALCKRYDVPYYNYLNYSPIANEADYFQDMGHLNNEGAYAFSRVLVNEVLNKKY
jgi:hypothetical protein